MSHWDLQSSESSEIIRRCTIGQEGSPEDNPLPTEEATCSREDVSADLSIREGVFCAGIHESALGICL